jgi:hypothetical protein
MMSDAQREYIIDLYYQANIEYDEDELNSLSSKEASKLINELKELI